MDLLTFFVGLTVLAILAPILWSAAPRLQRWITAHRDPLLLLALSSLVVFAVVVGRWGGLW